MKYAYKTVDSPLGILKIVGSDTEIVALLWENDDPKRVVISAQVTQSDTPMLVKAATQIEHYFSKKRNTFDLPFTLYGSDFQKQVWQALMAVEYGTTVTYAQLAARIGKPNAARAVGHALGKNPLSIIVPCHRVIGAQGRIAGFAGGIRARKFLLDLEK